MRLAVLGWRRVNEREEARRNVSGHYDRGNEFFKMWLGKEMVYSCAYFRGPEDDIDAAQERKLRHICTKLRLREGTRLIDIGCGWGGLLVHAAKCHGVVGLGVTLSREQVQEARERIAIQGLSDQIEVELRDYREIAETDGFDRIVSIGMFEHIGKQRYPEYFRQTARLLRAGGGRRPPYRRTPRRGIGQPVADQVHLSRYLFPLAGGDRGAPCGERAQNYRRRSVALALRIHIGSMARGVRNERQPDSRTIWGSIHANVAIVSGQLRRRLSIW